VGFYRFTLAELYPHNPRGHVNDILIMTLGVVVNNRDQGFYSLTTPIFYLGRPQSPDDLRQNASVNGYPGPKSTNSRTDFSVGPIEIADDDEVIILYAGNNISDDPDLVHRQDFDQTLTKAVSALYVAMLGGVAGELITTLGLGSAIQFIKGLLPGDVDKFLSNPVGFLLGVGPTGPCNGLVYQDKLEQNGHVISQLAYEPLPIDQYLGSMAKATLKKSYADSAYGHDTNVCGQVANTDVTIEITRYEKFPLDLGNWGGVNTWGPLKDGHVTGSYRPHGIRENSGLGSRAANAKQLYGLRN
jgi:hypothetical protein